MSKHEFFRRSYDLPRDLLVDLLQQAMDGMPTITSHRLADSGDRITFRTSFTLTSWGEKMVAEVREDGPERSVLIVSGEPRVGLLGHFEHAVDPVHHGVDARVHRVDPLEDRGHHLDRGTTSSSDVLGELRRRCGDPVATRHRLVATRSRSGPPHPSRGW